MRVAEVFEKTNIEKYTHALLMTESQKTCTNLASATNQSHDKIYREFENPTQKSNQIRNQLIDIVKEELSGELKYLLFDDSQLSKPHANEIEGIDICFDGSTGRPELGLQIVTAMITDGDVRIPVDLRPYFSKQVSGNYFKTKSELAIAVTSELVKIFDLELFIADAHYATPQTMSFLRTLQLNFLMKFPRNRIVTIDKKHGQVRDLLKLRRNEHMRSICGFFGEIPCCFYVAKLKTGCTVYFISLYPIKHNYLVELYKIRWSIELYHRTAKQSLGWNDCQMRASEKQVLHSFHVMHAYAIAELVRIKLKLDTTEDAIRHVRQVKAVTSTKSIIATGENLCQFA